VAHTHHHSELSDRVVLLGDHDTVREHAGQLADSASQQGCVIAETFSFAPGEPAAATELLAIEPVMSALARCLTERIDLWVPFPIPDLAQEQHVRRLSLVLQRHGLDLRVHHELWPLPVDGGWSGIDHALRREVQYVDELDQAVLASIGIRTLSAEIEAAMASTVGAPLAECAPLPSDAWPGGFDDCFDDDRSVPLLPAPEVSWERRLPMLRRYAAWLIYECRVSQAATARVLNAAGQPGLKGKYWRSESVGALVNGRYDMHRVRRPRSA